MINNSWILCSVGILFCLGGVYLFFRGVYEENKSIAKPFLVIIGGVVLIGLGTAKFFHLIN
jgi:uncharacterized membrane protein